MPPAKALKPSELSGQERSGYPLEKITICSHKLQNHFSDSAGLRCHQPV